MTELQAAYDELKISSEKQISELRVQVSSLSVSTSKGKCGVSLTNEKVKSKQVRQ